MSPSEQRSGSLHHSIQSATHSPVGSRRGSTSSVASAQTDPGLEFNRNRQLSSSSTQSTASARSGFRSIFSSRGEKKDKPKKQTEKIVLTSRHAAVVKTKMMMMDHQSTKGNAIKTAGVVGTTRTGHMTAAEQEARHPHSGPPAVHARSGDMPLLTRIVSGDERDDEDEFAKLQEARLQWEAAKISSFADVREHGNDDGVVGLAEQSTGDDETLHPEEPVFGSEPQATFSNSAHRRSTPFARNTYGGRFHRNDSGNWTR